MVFECHFVKGSRNGETSTYSFKTSRPPNDLYWNTMDGIMTVGGYIATNSSIILSTDCYRMVWWDREHTAVYVCMGFK